MVPNASIPGSASSSSTPAMAEACTDGDRFPREVAKTAILQICDAIGFNSIQLSAVDTLADIAIRYLSDVGKASQFYANLAGRTHSNALDVISALEDVNGSTEGGGLADIHSPVSDSGTVKELMRFVEFGDEIPFIKPVPHFPIVKKRSLTPSFAQLGEQPPHPHIPPWLPAFPDPHTYKSTPVWNDRKTDPKLDKLDQARQRRKAERSLVSLHLRLSSSGASPSCENASDLGVLPLVRSQALGGPGLDQENYGKPEGDGAQGKMKSKRPPASVQNPFLAPPLPPDAKEVSSLDFTFKDMQAPVSKSQKVKGQVALPSVLEAFAPALEAARREFEGGGNQSRQPSTLPDPKDRMPVLLTMDSSKKAQQKTISACLSLGGSKDRKKTRPPPKEEEKDEKKRRAEQILAQSMEGNEDAAQ